MITINLDKAKSIAHDYRRSDRSVKMAPLDIEATVPALAESAEAKREVIRQENARVQTEIDAAASADELKTILTTAEMLK